MSELRNKLKEDLLSKTEGIIEFRSYLVKREDPTKPSPPNLKALIEPKRNPANDWFYGVDKISEEEKKNTTDIYVDPLNKEHPLSSYELEHKKQMDLSKLEDRLILKWLLECDHVLGLSYDEKKNSPTAKFYIYNEILDTSNRVSKLELKDKAVAMLNDIPETELNSIARLMGMHLGGRSKKEIYLVLRELFEEPKTWYDRVEQFIKVVHDPRRKYKLFIFHAMDRGVINQNDKGSYYWEDIFLGYTLDEVIAFFRQAENKQLLMQISELSSQQPPFLPLGTEKEKEEVEKTSSRRGRPPKKSE